MTQSSPQMVRWVAWALTLLMSALPDLLGEALLGGVPSALLLGKWGGLGLGLASTWLVPTLRSLRPYLLLLALLMGASAAAAWVQEQPFWTDQVGTGLQRALLGGQGLRLGITGVMVGGLLVLGFSRQASFLRRGDLRATARRVRAIGMRRDEPWTVFGRNLTLIITGVTVLFLVLSPIDLSGWGAGIVSLWPWVLGLAALNAWNEEISYRAALLAPLREAVGDGHALALTATIFGLAHFHGVPYGLIGVLLAGFLGWVLGKSMLETQGLFWAWLIHFCQDVVIFSFLLQGLVAPGG